MPISVVTEQAGQVATVRIERQERLNSLGTADFAELARAIRSADAAGPTAIVLTGEGRAFCSGADLSGTVDAETVAVAADLIRAIADARAVVVARVHGPAAGVGVSIALACDLVIAAESAFLLVPFLPLGLVPDGGATRLLTLLAGPARAARMAFGGERVSATAAQSWGLIAEAVADELLDERLGALVDRLLDAPDEAVFATKRLLRAAERPRLDEALDAELEVQGHLLAGADFALAREAFRAKRPQSFRR